MQDGDDVVLTDQSGIACLVLESGAPYQKGACFFLNQAITSLGRTTSVFKPDIAFDSLLISRRHCCIKQSDGSFVLYELGSRHGSLLNGVAIEVDSPYPLADGDRITLASSVVMLRFALSAEADKTIEFAKTQALQAVAQTQASPIGVDMGKKVLVLDRQEISLSVKQWRLLALLYAHRNELVSYRDLCLSVWPERCLLPNGVPDVGVDEVNMLLHRLRLKLGKYGGRLKTRRGQGCLLETE